MKKITILFLIVLLLSVFSAPALAFDKTLPGSAMNPIYRGGWQFPLRSIDGDYTTLSNTLPGNAGFYTFISPPIYGITSMRLVSRLADDPANVSIILPASCRYQNRINLTVTSSYNPTDDSVYITCRNSTNTDLVVRSKGGTSLSTGFYDLTLFVNYTDVASCSPRSAYPVLFQEFFNYPNPIAACGWAAFPELDKSPTSGFLCSDSPTYPQYYAFDVSGLDSGYDVPHTYTEELTFTGDNSTFFEKFLTFPTAPNQNIVASNPSLILGLKAYDIWITGYNHGIQYLSIINGSSIGYSLCSNCWNNSNLNKLQITIFSNNASSYSYINASDHSIGHIQPSTFMININGAIYPNLPLAEATGEMITYSPLDTYFEADAGNFCFTNYGLTSGLSAASQITGVPNIPVSANLQPGEKCENNAQCLTGYCNYLSKCDRKGFAEFCVNAFECASGRCQHGKCLAPSLAQSATNAKNDLFGSDSATSDLVSLILVLIPAFLLAAWGMASGLFIIGGALGVAWLILSVVLFVIMGWLSPIYLVGVFLMFLVVASVLIVLGSRGQA